jgi:site-specific DNA recombinase
MPPQTQNIPTPHSLSNPSSEKNRHIFSRNLKGGSSGRNRSTAERASEGVIYGRKSSEQEDRQVLSVESQLREDLRLAQEHGVHVPGERVFTEAMSAKRPGRPAFAEMLGFFHRGECDTLIAFKLDRIARNMLEGGQVIQLLQEGKIRRIITTERTYLPADNVLMIAVEFGMANQYSRDLSVHVRNAIKTKVASGQYPGLAPIGYLNDLSREEGRRTIIADPERFEQVRTLWHLMLTGSYAVPALWRKASDEMRLTTPQYGKIGGRILSKNTLYNVFHSHFYRGWFELNGELHPGSHPPMVTEDQFWRVQELLGRDGLPRPQRKHDFAFTGGLIRCGECGCSITAERHTKTNKHDGRVHKWTYYRCTKKKPGVTCSQPFVEVRELERQVDGFLASITIPGDIVEWALDSLRTENVRDRAVQRETLEAMRRDLEQNETARRRLMDLRLRDLVDDEEFRQRRSELASDGERLGRDLANGDDSSNLWLNRVEGAFCFCKEARTTFADGDRAVKRQMLEFVGSNLILEDKKLTIYPGEFFAGVQKAVENQAWLPLLHDVRTTSLPEWLPVPPQVVTKAV